jgi:GcrA cell cycle regulator
VNNHLNPSWPAEDDALLRQLWDDKLSSRVIGKIMKRSKNAVVGRAHRLLLTPRQSPIRGGPSPQAHRKKGAAGLVQALMLASKPTPKTPAPEKRPLRVWIPPLPGPVSACQWPIGHPRTPGFRFCEAPSVPGRSYCLEHCRRAYVGFTRQSTDQPGGFHVHVHYHVVL